MHYCVADTTVLYIFDAGNYITNLASTQHTCAFQIWREVAYLCDFCCDAALEKLDTIAFFYLSIKDAGICHDSAILVINSVKDQ